MGDGGSTAEVGRSRQANAWKRWNFGRRTRPWQWCGVVLCTVVTFACTQPERQPNPSNTNVLRIGFAEGGIAGAERLGQLTTIFSLEGLTQVGVDGRPLPRLASRWAWENEFLRLRLYLRPDVQFHDGTPLTARVAADALNLAIERNRPLYPSFGDVTGVRADTDSELVIDLSQPSAFLPEALDLPIGIGAKNAGTGPYQVVETNGSAATLRRFDRYYLGAPQIEEIVIHPYTLRTAWTSLLRGEVDMVTEVPPQTVDFVRNDQIEVLSFARRYQFLVAFNSSKPPFNSTTVRRAMNFAVDRDRLIANILEGRGETATGPLWPKHWAYDQSLKPYTYDPQVTTSLLDSAGLRLTDQANGRPPARLRFTCLLPEDFTLLERIGLEVQKQLYDVGVDMQFDVVPFLEYNERIGNGQFEAVLFDLISGPTLERPFIFWGSARHSKFLNVFGYENPEAERSFQSMRRAINEAAFRSTANRLQRVLLDDPPALFLMWNERARAVRRQFQMTGETDRDPLYTIWQWTDNRNGTALSQ
jgi:peptide/nickel transport system substrate-binding protein